MWKYLYELQFPTGFHGHLRSRPRNDFVCEFRKLARPQPPKKFIARSQVCLILHYVTALPGNKRTFPPERLQYICVLSFVLFSFKKTHLTKTHFLLFKNSLFSLNLVVIHFCDACNLTIKCLNILILRNIIQTGQVYGRLENLEFSSSWLKNNFHMSETLNKVPRPVW